MIRRAVHGEFVLADGPTGVGEACARFRGDPGAWLPGPATSTPDGYRVHLVVPSARPVPEVAALVVVGAAVAPTPRLVVRSIAWRAEIADDLFPVLRAELELHAGRRARLRLVGSYTPPLSVLGALADQVVGRHVATGVVGDFVATVARHLVESTTPGAGGRNDVPSWREQAAPLGPST